MNKREQIGEAELQLLLRGLRQEVTPDQDLWPAIAQRISGGPQKQVGPHLAERRWWRPVALVASLLLVVGVAWRLQLAHVPASQAAGFAQQHQHIDMLSAQYRAAWLELSEQPVSANFRPGLLVLDRTADQLREALQHAPESRLLQQQLHAIYSRRLVLLRRAIHT